MSYTVLARKYRPQTFADLVGQEHVSRTIGNAISGGRVAHAFLFTGARGVGKTTTARLLAKALNCEKGPTAEPCNQCDACKEITVGNDLDVLEIDGASNNSVDDVRRLQETLPFRPVRDRFKVVIVDEVHMLSTGAFNAFLKTLEEPPEHVKFIFATTEVHKVPVTIRSRCQRYDFRLITHAVVSARVKEILAKEGISADDAAIAIVVREAAGSMRDALTVLDQLLALGGDKLEGEKVARGLGIASRKHVFTAIEAMLNGDAATCLRTVNGVGEQGLDMLHFARQLLECVRDLVVLRVLGDDAGGARSGPSAAPDELVDLVADERQEALRIAQSKSRQELERGFAGLGKLVEEVGASGTPQITLEMGLVRLADRPPLTELRELIDRMKALEERLGAGPSPSGGGGGGPRAHGDQGRGDSRFVAPAGAGGSVRSAPRTADSAPRAADTTSRVESREASPTESRVESSARMDSVIKREPSRPPIAAVLASASATAASTSSLVGQIGPVGAAAAAVIMPAPLPAQPATLPAQPATLPAAVGGDNGYGNLADSVLAQADLPPLWLRIVSQLKASLPALGAVLEHGMPLEVSTQTLRIGFPDGSFFGRQAQTSSAREAILKIAEEVLGGRPTLVIGNGGASKIATLAEVEQDSRKHKQAERRAVALRHPRVREALEVFGESEDAVQVESE